VTPAGARRRPASRAHGAPPTRRFRRVAVALAVVVAASGCSAIGRPQADEPTDDRLPERTNLAPTPSRQEVAAGALCATVSRADLVECDVLPLFPPERRECPEDRPATGSPPCALAGQDGARRLGWTLTLEPGRGRLRTLTVFSGTDNLATMLRGSDANPPWLAASVCPSDVTGDGLIDLVALFRSSATPDRVAVEVVNIADDPTRVLTLALQPFDPIEPQGCRSKLLDRLRYDQPTRRLQLDPEEDADEDQPVAA
jgi:hypothetical protein